MSHQAAKDSFLLVKFMYILTYVFSEMYTQKLHNVFL